MPNGLTKADVEHLLTEPSAQAQAQTAAKIAEQFTEARLSDREQELASDIFRTLVNGADVVVREVLGAQLSSSEELPHDIALSLAKDVDSVALPMLRYSDVLSDEDLVEIVSQTGEDKQTAIAERASVSSALSEALIDHGNEEVVNRLVANEKAEIAESGFEKVMTKHANSTSIGDSLSRRASMPPAIVEKVVGAVSERLRDYLSSRKDISTDAAAGIILQARERAIVDLARGGGDEFAVERLVDQLHGQKRLTASLLFRTLCFGDLAFFEAALARLANVPLSNTRILLHEGGDLAFKSIYGKAQLPPRLLPAFREAMRLRDEMDVDGGPDDRQRFQSHMLERMLTAFEGDETLSPDDVEFLMEKLSHMAA
ncbi:DUF2336 domain-containing protein [Rhodovibrionaceae bacterium A322]